MNVNRKKNRNNLLNPYLYIAKLFAVGIIFFLLARTLFYFYHLSPSDSLSWGLVLKSYAVGFRFDLLLLSALFFPLLLVLPWIDLSNKFVRIITNIYLTTIFTLSLFGILADLRFYASFQSRLNYLALEYMGEGTMALDLVMAEKIFWLVIFLTIASIFLFYFLFKYLYPTQHNTNKQKLSHRIGVYVVAIILTAIGMRGGVGMTSLDWASAFISDSNFVNQMTLNPVYTFAKSFQEENRDPRLSYMDDKQRFAFSDFGISLKNTQNILLLDNETLLEPDKNIKRRSIQPELEIGFKPNVVIVLMESFSARYIGALGSELELTPQFDSLSQHAVLFNNFYSASSRSNFGLSATLCSFPALPGRAMIKRYKANHPFITISEILRERDYFNGFIYGGDLTFDNVEGFFKSKGYDKFWGKDDFESELQFSKWGVPDHLMFNEAIAIIDSLPRPFQLTIFTLSNHEPFDLPDSSLQKFEDDSDSSRIYNAMHYADNAIGKFMNDIRKSSLHDSTIFIFTADHALYGRGRYNLDPNILHIPLLIYAPFLIGDSSQVNEKFGGQVDIIPTLMGLLGGDYTHSSWGRNLLSLEKEDDGFAILNVLNKIGFITKDLYYFETVGYGGALFTAEDLLSPTPVKASGIADKRALELRELFYRYLQTAEQLSTPTTN